MIAIVLMKDREQIDIKCDFITPPDLTTGWYTFYMNSGESGRTPIAYFQADSVAAVIDSRHTLLSEKSE